MSFLRVTLFCGIDGDHCRNKDTNEIDIAVKTELEKINTYCELSPSEEGIHAIVKGKLPGGGLGPEEDRLFEMYDNGRYFTMTGHCLGEFSDNIEERTRSGY